MVFFLHTQHDFTGGTQIMLVLFSDSGLAVISLKTATLHIPNGENECSKNFRHTHFQS